MRAVVLRAFGGPERLRIEDIPEPEPGPGEVRIAVRAAGTNPVDAGNRADGSWAGIELPHVPGYDVAGVIDAVGPGVAGMRPGDPVIAMTSFPTGAGGYAELVATAAGLVAVIAPDTDPVLAASTPLAAGTALEVLDRLAVPAPGSVLVLGASGGVRQFVLQLGRHRGLSMIGAGGRASHERMLSQGAIACIDYANEPVASRAVELAAGRVDAIADLVGGDQLAHAIDALRP